MKSNNKNHPMTDSDKILFVVFIVSFLIGAMIDIRFGFFNNFFMFSILLKSIGCIAFGSMVLSKKQKI